MSVMERFRTGGFAISRDLAGCLWSSARTVGVLLFADQLLSWHFLRVLGLFLIVLAAIKLHEDTCSK